MSFKLVSFYRAMHFSAKRGHAITCRLSVSPSVPSVTLVDCDHIGWNSSEIISPLVSINVKKTDQFKTHCKDDAMISLH